MWGSIWELWISSGCHTSLYRFVVNLVYRDLHEEVVFKKNAKVAMCYTYLNKAVPSVFTKG